MPVMVGRTASHPQHPAPLVSPFRHPIKWVGVASLSVIAALVFAHIGSLDITGLYYAERHVASGRPMRWYHPPTFRARCNAVAAQQTEGGSIATYRFGALQAVLLVMALVPAVVFAVLGYYVLTVIAV